MLIGATLKRIVREVDGLIELGDVLPSKPGNAGGQGGMAPRDAPRP